MSRDAGFAIADFSTSHHDDAKVKAMWRALLDEAAMNAAMTLYEAVVLASWRDGKRVTAAEACPVWISDVAVPTKHLTDHELLDSDGRIVRPTWNQWFGPAKKRRQDSRDSWRRSKAEARARAKVLAESDGSPRGLRGESTVPSVRPSVRPNRPPRAGGRGAEAPETGSNGAGPSFNPDSANRVLSDPTASDQAKAGARAYLELHDRFGPTAAGVSR